MRFRARVRKIDRKIIKDIAARCGLTPASVRNLLNSGWTYTETIHEPLKWVREF